MTPDDFGMVEFSIEFFLLGALILLGFCGLFFGLGQLGLEGRALQEELRRAMVRQRELERRLANLEGKA